MKKIVKTRTKTITLWLTEEEREYIKGQAKRCGYSVQEYLRRLVYDKPIQEKPPPEFHEVLKNLRQINNNMNQVAAKANAMNFIDTAKYWANVSELQRLIGKLVEDTYNEKK